jgi:eukaryotic-like serine/threonine-protein kinase
MFSWKRRTTRRNTNRSSPARGCYLWGSKTRPRAGVSIFMPWSHAESDPARDERLAVALDELVRQQGQAGGIDFDVVAERHPDLADELKQLLVVGQFVNGLARADPQATQPSVGAGKLAPSPLPREIGGYELVEELGRGAMGVVYKAWDKGLKRFVALKMVLRGTHASAIDQGRFRAEAQAAAGLTHPSIVPVYQVGEHDAQAFFCMKYVAGQTLAGRVAAGPLPQRQAAGYLAAIARAVQHAHEHGILHRDLKPSNILIDDDNCPLVTDFGLAKRVEGGQSLTGTGAIVGTPSYMAPELTEGKSASPASDVYALGAMLYEMLTGRPPFLAASVVETLLLIRTEEPVRLRLLNPKIDTDLELICRKCLEKNPQHRYATAADLARDLTAFLAGEPVSARSSSMRYFVARLLRDTHHAPVLENWGVLWMVHAVKIFGLCVLTSVVYALGYRNHLTYLLVWSISLVAWGAFFWHWRKRGGPVTFVERQLAHAWAAGVVASIGTFFVEAMLRLDVLTLTPVLTVAAGMVFLFEAGMLSGEFYLYAGLAFAMAVAMVGCGIGPPWSPLLLGIASAVGFFVPGWKYYRLRRRRSAGT